MPKRIPVVLSQSPRSDARCRTLEEDLVTQLLMENGIEVTLIPHLGLIQRGDTGILCLEGIQGDLILLSWLDSSEAKGLLESHGISGRVGRTRLGGDISVDQQDHDQRRIIYHIDLRCHGSPSAFRDEIMHLREETSVQVIDLGMASGVTTSNQRAPVPQKDIRSGDPLDALIDRLDELEL